MVNNDLVKLEAEQRLTAPDGFPKHTNAYMGVSSGFYQPVSHMVPTMSNCPLTTNALISANYVSLFSGGNKICEEIFGSE